MIENVIVL